MFQEYALGALQHVSVEAWRLPTDSSKRMGDGAVMCRRFLDELTNYRRDFIIENASKALIMYPIFAGVAFIKLRGGSMTTYKWGVSMSNLLRILAADSMECEVPKVSARKGLKRLLVGKTNAYSAAAQGLLLQYRANIADYNRPHVSEALWVWRFLTEDQLRNLLKRLLGMVCPRYSELAGPEYVRLQTRMRVSSELHLLHVVNETLLSDHMIHWGEIVRQRFNAFANFLDQDSRQMVDHGHSQHAAPANFASVEAAKRSYNLSLRSKYASAPVL